MSVILGVDPGGTGAFALLHPDGTLENTWDMPAHDGIVSAPLIADLIDNIRADWPIAVAYVENVHSMPKQGVASSFKFGRAFGVAVGVLGGARVPVEYIEPSVWKRKAGLTGQPKDASRHRAIELWPSVSHLFARVKDGGRADAALIARHGLLHLTVGAAS